ncbi:MAG: hypothetical protein ACLUV1_07875 [Evtepia gabavorous]|uniref:hypothetical protein n=1 Tax=Evtepia gabavorous TaxID=2211183 RepID=UPI00399B3C6D
MKQYRPILFSFLLLALCLTAACAWDNPSPAPGDASSSSAGEPGESSAVAVSDAIPFSQAVTQYAGNAGLSYQAARTAFPAGTDAEPAEEAHYRILSLPLSVTASYTPRLILYCAVSEANASLVSVDAIQLLQQEGNTSQQNRSFHGDIQVWLRGNTQLEYVINGDFYNGEPPQPWRPVSPSAPARRDGSPSPSTAPGSPLISSISMTIRRSPFPLPWHNGPFAPALVAASLSDPNPSMWSK